jgi:hypothetical protein
VTAGASTPNAFVLQGGTEQRGYVQYQLIQAGSNYDLVGLPSQAAFEVVRTGEEAERFWQRSADAWSDQMRNEGIADVRGPNVWAQFAADGGSLRSRPIYQVQGVTQFVFSPNVDLQESWAGAQTGLGYGFGSWGVGVTAGYGNETASFSADSGSLDLNGYNVGGYLRWHIGGLFLHGLVKYDSYIVRQDDGYPAFSVQFNGSTVGGQLQAGYRWVRGAGFLEPIVAVSVTHTRLDTLNSPLLGVAVDFHGDNGTFGEAGVRAGLQTPFHDWTLSPYVGFYVEDELSSAGGVTIATGPTGLTLGDTRPAGWGRAELGLVGRAATGLELSASFSGESGASYNGVGGRIGALWRW